MNTPDGAKSDEGPKSVGRILKRLFLLLIGMSMYAYFRLSHNKAAFPGALVLLNILEVVRLKRMYKESGWEYAGCEVAYFPALMLFSWAVYHHPVAVDNTFIFAMIAYRPYYTLFCNRRLAFILGLLILAVVVPITCGIATNPAIVDLLTALYAILVAGLWAFCSEFGATVFGLE